MPVSIHCCYADIKSWVNQDKQLVAKTLQAGAIKPPQKKRPQQDDAIKMSISRTWWKTKGDWNETFMFISRVNLRNVTVSSSLHKDPFSCAAGFSHDLFAKSVSIALWNCFFPPELSPSLTLPTPLNHNCHRSSSTAPHTTSTLAHCIITLLLCHHQHCSIAVSLKVISDCRCELLRAVLSTSLSVRPCQSHNNFSGWLVEPSHCWFLFVICCSHGRSCVTVYCNI